jgi:hypothetical protein
MRTEILAFALLSLILYSLVSVPTWAAAQSTLQLAKIELSVNKRFLRGELAKVSGRLSTIPDDRPIALATVHLQYHRVGETDLARELVIITSNPGGRFEDIFNTTSLLRIGTWVVNASFPKQFGYESTSTQQTFAIMVQPTLSLYVSSHDITLGHGITFNGLLFACIPCIQDEVVVIFNRPDNTSASASLRLVPTGGPYPGGFYNGSFMPDVTGKWRIRAVWKGNEVTLPTYSQVQELAVEAPQARSDGRMFLYGATVAAVFGAVVLAAMLRRRRLRESSTGSRLRP